MHLDHQPCQQPSWLRLIPHLPVNSHPLIRGGAISTVAYVATGFSFQSMHGPGTLVRAGSFYGLTVGSDDDDDDDAQVKLFE